MHAYRRHRPAIPALALLTLTACSPQQASQAPDAGPVQVSTVTMQPQAVTLTTELPGRTEAYLISDVRPQVTGIVKTRNFVEGREVKEGEQLYQIDPATYQAAVDIAAATLTRREATYATAQAKTGRYTALVSRDVVSQQTYDDAVATSNEAKADIASAKASLEQARINLAYTEVKAPISGRIGRSSVTPGALVTANQTTSLATVTQLDPIYVNVTQSVTDLLRLKRAFASGKLESVGENKAKVALKLEDGSAYAEPGVLQFSEVNVDQGTGTVVLRATFPNPQKLLLPGMYVHAQIQEGTDNTAFLVPQQAVTRNAHGDATVLVVEPDDIVALRVIDARKAVGESWIVPSGLKAGDRVIVSGLQKVKPGDRVQASPAPANATKEG